MIRILTIFGTRPEAIKMAPVIQELERRSDKIKSLICVTAQHRQMLDQILDFFAIRPDIDLNLMKENQSLASLTSRAVIALTEVLEQTKPDCVLVQGDTTTAMAAALASFYQKIPIGHVEAGLRTLDRYSPFPEEINRRLIGSLATYHFVPTQKAVRALCGEGISAETVFLTGNTVVDALHWTVVQAPSAETRKVFSRIGLSVNGRANGGGPKRVILVTAHRRENFGRPLENICTALKRIVTEISDVMIVYPVHLNPRVRGPVRDALEGEERIHLIDPLPYEPFSHLMKAATLVLTDSGGIQEEAPAMGKPVLVMRAETERPEAVESGVARVVGTETEDIVREAKKLLLDKEEYYRMAQPISPFGDGRASVRIVKTLLESLTGGSHAKELHL